MSAASTHGPTLMDRHKSFCTPNASFPGSFSISRDHAIVPPCRPYQPLPNGRSDPTPHPPLSRSEASPDDLQAFAVLLGGSAVIITAVLSLVIGCAAAFAACCG